MGTWASRVTVLIITRSFLRILFVFSLLSLLLLSEYSYYDDLGCYVDYYATDAGAQGS